MNDRQLERKITKDADKVKRDVSTLVGDSAVQLSRFGDDVSEATDKAREDLTAWAEDGASRVGEGFEKLRGDATEAAATLQKDVGHGLSQYNAKAREVANKVSGGIGEMVARYPWVAISIGLGIGLLLGGLLNPGRKLHG